MLERVDSEQPLTAAACSGCRGPSQLAAATSSSSSSSGGHVFACSSSRTTAASCGSNIVGSSSSNGSSNALLAQGGFYSRCARLVCSRLPGLALGGEIAAGTHGRVFRADYNCMKVGGTRHVRLACLDVWLVQ
jgi:hypothetical protein